MTIHEATQRLIFQLFDLYEEREARNIADMVMERITGFQKIDRVIHKKLSLLPAQAEDFERFSQELIKNRPVQYVLGEAWFAGMPFFVNENVLIPRPETEELVEWITNDTINKNSNQQILDIGTGSGCIPIALKKYLSAAAITACDVSGEALDIAKTNADRLHLQVSFVQCNFLDEPARDSLPGATIIVSNPPYIPFENRNEMRNNVLAYEPHLALFVPDEDPFIFYKAISRFAEKKLLPGGSVYVEIHEGYGDAVSDIFKKAGLEDVVVKTDLQGKERMVKASNRST